jgi:hypothetical protein
MSSAMRSALVRDRRGFRTGALVSRAGHGAIISISPLITERSAWNIRIKETRTA